MTGGRGRRLAAALAGCLLVAGCRGAQGVPATREALEQAGFRQAPVRPASTAARSPTRWSSAG